MFGISAPRLLVAGAICGLLAVGGCVDTGYPVAPGGAYYAGGASDWGGGWRSGGWHGGGWRNGGWHGSWHGGQGGPWHGSGGHGGGGHGGSGGHR